MVPGTEAVPGIFLCLELVLLLKEQQHSPDAANLSLCFEFWRRIKGGARLGDGAGIGVLQVGLKLHLLPAGSAGSRVHKIALNSMDFMPSFPKREAQISLRERLKSQQNNTWGC